MKLNVNVWPLVSIAVIFLGWIVVAVIVLAVLRWVE
jgi:hypothetical protein